MQVSSAKSRSTANSEAFWRSFMQSTKNNGQLQEDKKEKNMSNV